MLREKLLPWNLSLYNMLMLLLFLFNTSSADHCYLKMYSTDLHEIFRIGRYVGGNDQSETHFLIAKVKLWFVASFGANQQKVA